MFHDLKNKYIKYLLLLAYFIVLITSVWRILTINILPFKYVLIILSIGLIILGFLYFMLKSSSKFIKITSYFLILFFSISMFWASMQISGLETFFDNQTASVKKDVSINVVVLKDSKYKTINDIKNKEIVAPTRTDIGSIKLLSEDLRNNKKIVPKIINVNSYLDGAKSLLNKEQDIAIISSKYIDDIEKELPNFQKKTKVLYSLDINLKDEINHDIDNISNQPFNIYISGDDQYENLEGTGRSDVNIIATINPKTKQILLTSIPRDYYVKIANHTDAYDKLTHLSTLGLNTSIKSLEDLLKTKISYYVRINFSSLITFVDKIGNIKLNNPTYFNTNDISFLEYEFPEGNLELDGRKALAYCRERHFFDDERIRGKNQERVISAIIDKVTQPEILINFGNILSSVGQLYHTNISKSEITELIKMQLDNNQKWDIQTISLNGLETNGYYSYLMPTYELFFLLPHKASIDYAHKAITKILDGEENFKVDNSFYQPSDGNIIYEPFSYSYGSGNITNYEAPQGTNQEYYDVIPENTQSDYKVPKKDTNNRTNNFYSEWKKSYYSNKKDNDNNNTNNYSEKNDSADTSNISEYNNNNDLGE